MALKRAEARALRKAAPLGVDIGTMADANDWEDVIEGEATFVDQEEGDNAVAEPESEMQPLTDEEFEMASGLLVEAFQDAMISKTLVKDSGIQTATLLREGVAIDSIVEAVQEKSKGLGW